MASSIVSSAARQLGKSLVEEAKYLYAVKDKVEALHEELSWMHTFLQDADTREHCEEIIRMWVFQIRDFAYEAEDIVENYLHRVSSHRQEGIWNTFKWFSCICCDGRALHGVGSDIDCLKHKISELSTRMHTYGVKPTSIGNQVSHRKRVMELRRTSSHIEKEEIIGLKEDTKELVEKLVRSDHKVVCIFGMGGLGKTTLAKMVYREIKEEFKNRVWVYVSQQFQTRNILEAILVKFTSIGDQNSRNIKDLRDEELPSEVYKVLKEKKCLVVLDDIWSEQAWDILAPAFKTLRNSDCQSKLLLTTRSEGLLSHVDSKGFNHPVKSLTDEESWELLKKISLSGNLTSGSEVENLKEMGEKMAKHCNGLPLALVVLGGILATKSSVDEWEKVQENIVSCLKNGTSNQDNLSISQVLELSYDDLPYYLKPCFLHLGNFPEDFEIPTKTLFYMWAIEGIVAQSTYTTAGEVSVEAIAENYLKELANRCLVQLDRTGKVGKIKSCRLHDLIRDMCLTKSKEENFLKVIAHGDLEKQSSSHSSSLINQRFRRLVVYMHKSSGSLQNLISEQNNHHVRSLLFFPAGEVPRKLNWPQGTVSEALKLVRVLHFDNVCIRSLPKEIGELIHLRYLSLKGTRLSSLPSSIGKLRYLQILDLRVCDCIDVIIPNVIWKLEKLKHLYLPNNWEVETSLFFPAVKRKLRLRGLIQLETLENLRLEVCLVKDLLKLAKLKKITLANCMVTEVECLKSFLKCSSIAGGQLKRPLSLTLDGNVLSKEPSILSSNSQLQFHKLHVSGKILLRLRYARLFPQDLKQLTLNDSELKDDPMPILERLFHLTELTLGENTFLGTEIQCTAGNFPKLAVLRLVQLTNLQEWKVKEGAMPGLKNLYIYSCENLKEIPSELPKEVKIGCRPCVQGFDNYGNCCYTTQQAPGASDEVVNATVSVSVEQEKGEELMGRDESISLQEIQPETMQSKAVEKITKNPTIKEMTNLLKWMDSESLDGRLVASETTRDKAFFTILLEPKNWLTSDHMEEVLHFIRELVHGNPAQHNKVVVLDSYWASLLEKEFKLYQDNKESFRVDQVLIDYIEGKLPKRHGKSWEEADIIYVPYNFINKHWVALQIDLAHWCVNVYDSEVNLYSIHDVMTFLLPVTEMLPIILNQFKPLGNKYEQWCDNHLKVNCVQGLKTNKRGGDCGVYTLKYVEMLSAGMIELSSVSDESIDGFRNYMAHSIFNRKWETM